MSVDLIKVEATDDSLTLRYQPRGEVPYMVWHQQGTAGKAPARKWFSAYKESVWAAMMHWIKTGIKSRVMWFNDHATAGTPPSATGAGEEPDLQ